MNITNDAILRTKTVNIDNIEIPETKFNRQIAHDRRGQYKLSHQFYSPEELAALEEAHVADRLPTRITEHYMHLAMKSRPITNLIKARPEETNDLSGEADPSNQLRYSPVEGLLHKYELILLYVVRACSSWCRYCYRSDFLTNKTDKDIADVDQVAAYVMEYNANARAHNASLKEGEAFKPVIKEALLSGGDPMVLSNRNLFKYMHGLAKAGVETIRIGTKEMAFFPHRFDENFLKMLDIFHEIHPYVNLAFMVHFTHPHELLEIDDAGNYIMTEEGHYKRIPVTERAIQGLRSRHYVTLENQTPIISHVNDDADALRLLQIQLKKVGINNHYYFQCREIEGHKAFAVPVEEAWKIHAESQAGLSGIEKSRFAMSTEAGKLEVVSVIDAPQFAEMGVKVPPMFQKIFNEIVGEGLIIMRIHRTPYLNKQADIVIARRNPNALWISGYEDRIIYDGRKGRGEQYGPLAELVKTMFEAYQDDKVIASLRGLLTGDRQGVVKAA